MTARPSQDQGKSPAHSDANLDLAPAATAIGLVFAVLVGYEIPWLIYYKKLLFAIFANRLTQLAVVGVCTN